MDDDTLATLHNIAVDLRDAMARDTSGFVNQSYAAGHKAGIREALRLVEAQIAELAPDAPDECPEGSPRPIGRAWQE